MACSVAPSRARRAPACQWWLPCAACSRRSTRATGKPAKAEFKYAVAVSYYKLEVDGREVYEIDPVNGVRAINGVDQLAGMRNDLGL